MYRKIAHLLPRNHSRLVFVAVGILALYANLSSASANTSHASGTNGAHFTIAIVKQTPAQFGRITNGDLARVMRQLIAQQTTLDRRPRQPSRRHVRAHALTELLDMADIEGESRHLHISPSPARISRRFAEIKKNSFGSHADFKRYLDEAKLTEAEARERVRLQLLTQALEYRATAQVHGDLGKARALARFFESFAKRWKARTVCAPSFVIERCSNWK